jgi:hypothetical protein
LIVLFRKVPIDEFLLLDAFGRDVDFHDAYPQSVYLNIETGELLWLWQDDEDASMDGGIPPEENAAIRQNIETSPASYLEIPGRDHGEHHEILKDFLDSNWTDDDDARLMARSAYFRSIGGWIKGVNNDQAGSAYYDFRDHAIKSRAEQFLNEHGIEPLWK